jgi:hypothetical protein
MSVLSSVLQEIFKRLQLLCATHGNKVVPAGKLSFRIWVEDHFSVRLLYSEDDYAYFLSQGHLSKRLRDVFAFVPDSNLLDANVEADRREIKKLHDVRPENALRKT